MWGTGRGRNDDARGDRSGIKNVSGEENRSRVNPIQGAEFFRGFLVSRPTLHLQLGSSAESALEQAPPLQVKKKPFVFEKPKTDFHLDATKALLEDREERDLLMKEHGVPIHDCRADHPIGIMCRFCDGRRGSWAQPDVKPTKLFQQYQESILSSPKEVCTDLAAKDPDAEEDSYYADFGTFDSKFFE